VLISYGAACFEAFLHVMNIITLSFLTDPLVLCALASLLPGETAPGGGRGSVSGRVT